MNKGKRTCWECEHSIQWEQDGVRQVTCEPEEEEYAHATAQAEGGWDYIPLQEYEEKWHFLAKHAYREDAAQDCPFFEPMDFARHL